ncbi:MAG: hypothetical protein AB7G21_09115 [Dehalococcoidia bacterium]
MDELHLRYDHAQRGFMVAVIALACQRDQPQSRCGAPQLLAVDTGSTTTVLSASALPGLSVPRADSYLTGLDGRCTPAATVDVHFVVQATGQVFSGCCSVALDVGAHYTGVVGLDFIRELHVADRRARLVLGEADPGLLPEGHPGRRGGLGDHPLPELLAEMGMLQRTRRSLITDGHQAVAR